MKLHELLPLLQNLYGSQARAIDTGDGLGWAATYTADGQYKSPSYDRAFEGTDDLTTFGDSFPERSPGAKHLVSNIHVVSADDDQAEVILNFVIVQGAPGKSARFCGQSRLSTRSASKMANLGSISAGSNSKSTNQEKEQVK